MSSPFLRTAIEGVLAIVTVDRPSHRNAMNFEMYDAFVEACQRLRDGKQAKLVVIRGSGGAFIAGTDIAEFASSSGGFDGVAYERRIDEVLGALEALPMISCALVDGPAMGGGCLIAATCDFRIVTPRAKFGAPMARTLGNCLSSTSIARLTAAVGHPMARRMLLLAEILDAGDAVKTGFALSCVSEDDADNEITRLVTRIDRLAPLTISATKELLGRATAHVVPDDTDVIDRVYGSRDFRAGVRAFLANDRPTWEGR